MNTSVMNGNFNGYAGFEKEEKYMDMIKTERSLFIAYRPRIDESNALSPFTKERASISFLRIVELYVLIIS